MDIVSLRRWKRLGPPPGWDEAAEERENARIKAEAENRMNVFDKAPKRVRDRANAQGEEVVKTWWEEEGSWGF
jgi:hypothetical protein